MVHEMKDGLMFSMHFTTQSISVSVSDGAVSVSDLAGWMRQKRSEPGVWSIHHLICIPAGLHFQLSLQSYLSGKQESWQAHYGQPNHLHLQIFFCKYYIMFLTQQVPWAVEIALWEYGWMSAHRPVSSTSIWRLEVSVACLWELRKPPMDNVQWGVSPSAALRD